MTEAENITKLKKDFNEGLKEECQEYGKDKDLACVAKVYDYLVLHLDTIDNEANLANYDIKQHLLNDLFVEDIKATLGADCDTQHIYQALKERWYDIRKELVNMAVDRMIVEAEYKEIYNYLKYFSNNLRHTLKDEFQEKHNTLNTDDSNGGTNGESI